MPDVVKSSGGGRLRCWSLMVKVAMKYREKGKSESIIVREGKGSKAVYFKLAMIKQNWKRKTT